MVLSSNVIKPCANPFGIKNDNLFFSLKNTLIHFPYVGESFLISTAISITEPLITLTNLS